jgi:hypothetical protein
MKKHILFILLFFVSFTGFTQSTNTDAVEMADKFRADGKIYVVVAIAFVILAGIFTYLIMLDRKLSKLEKDLKNK